ncbi:MAG TPA: hypothetical protein VLK84_03165 [Longimicrobium sp.]|nr:hypothetical protein [Longimicrobium sp.]
MKKLSLDLETVVVQSFQTGDSAEKVPGTVRGHEAVGGGPTYDFTYCYTDCSCPPWW